MGSFESEKLQKLIDNDIQFFKKQMQTNPQAAQYLQSKIMFFQNVILPIVEADTTILGSECVKYYAKALSAAMRMNVNGFVTYTPLHDHYTDTPLIGIANPRAFWNKGITGNIHVDLATPKLVIENLDLSGYDNVKPILLTPLIH